MIAAVRASSVAPGHAKRMCRAGLAAAAIITVQTCRSPSELTVQEGSIPSVVEVAPAVDTLTFVGATCQYSAVVRDQFGKVIAGLPLIWESSDPAVATVTGGHVLARGKGAVRIRASTYSGLSGDAQLVVARRAVRLAIVAMIDSAEAQLPSDTVVKVAIEDDSGRVVTDEGVTVTLGLLAPAEGFVLSGDSVAYANRGLATFRGVSVSSPGRFALVARSDGLAPDTSDAFAVHGHFTQVTAGGSHTCALGAMGLAYCWGNNFFGQLGDSSTTTRLRPMPVVGRLRFTQISAGPGNTCALGAAGAVYCWGAGAHIVTLDGWKNDEAFPVRVPATVSFRAVSAGGGFTCAITTDDAVYCWGVNGSGQLGDGSTTDRWVAAPVAGSLRFSRISAGLTHVCGVTTSGAAYCWGGNSDGQLGDGSTTSRSIPTPVAAESTFVEIAAGARHSCGVTAAGAAYCWGAGANGQLGNGGLEARPLPTMVAGGAPLARVTAGTAHTCAVTAGGTAYCWGTGLEGQLGIGEIAGEGNVAIPAPVAGGLAFAHVSAKDHHSCGVTAEGVLFCWGASGYGELGDGTTQGASTPRRSMQ